MCKNSVVSVLKSKNHSTTLLSIKKNKILIFTSLESSEIRCTAYGVLFVEKLLPEKNKSDKQVHGQWSKAGSVE